MLRIQRPVIVAAVLAACALAGATGAEQRSAAPAPADGTWQSVPFTADAGERNAPTRRAEHSRQRADAAKPRQVAAHKSASPRPRRRVVAASGSEGAAPATAAARRRELERRLDALMPGARLGVAMSDPENPAWRRARPGRPAGEHNALSVPFDEKGEAALIGRGYHTQPDVQNPNGSTGATFGLRTRF